MNCMPSLSWCIGSEILETVSRLNQKKLMIGNFTFLPLCVAVGFDKSFTEYISVLFLIRGNGKLFPLRQKCTDLFSAEEVEMLKFWLNLSFWFKSGLC